MQNFYDSPYAEEDCLILVIYFMKSSLGANFGSSHRLLEGRKQ